MILVECAHILPRGGFQSMPGVNLAVRLRARGGP